MKADHPLSSGSQAMKRSKTCLAVSMDPASSSMYVYLYQKASCRGSSVTQRSKMFRAWLTNLFFISISAYLFHTYSLRYSMSRARSNTERARSNSFWSASHKPYFTHMPMFVRLLRKMSSNSLRLPCLYAVNSSWSVMYCFGALGASSMPRSRASLSNCSALIWIGAGARFFTCGSLFIFTSSSHSPKHAYLASSTERIASCWAATSRVCTSIQGLSAPAEQ